MTNTSLAIQKAVEGGWEKGKDFQRDPGLYFCAQAMGDPYDHVWLDPEFFKSLGKTEGWGETKISYRTKALDTSRVSRKGVVQVHIPAHNVNRIKKAPNKWKKVQHRLIDAIQQGRSIDEFFGEILKK